MSSNLKIVFAVLAVAVGVGIVSFGGLHRHIQRLAAAQAAEEQAHREMLSKPISTPTDVTTKAKIFWAGANGVQPVEVDLPLSADPVQRSQQLLRELIGNPPTPDQRTLPADTLVLGFYLLSGGTAIADFSDPISSEMPSGILSEEMALDSIVETLQANVSAIQQLKIVVHGQEVDTLAGHIDLTGFFDVNPIQPNENPSGTASVPAAPASGGTTPSGASPNPAH